MPKVDLHGFHVAALVSDRFEEVELVGPKEALEEAGAQVKIIASIPEVQAMRHYELGGKYHCDRTLDQARASNFDAMLLPGGVINGDNLRLQPAAQRFAREIVEANKPVAVICHGGWLLISSGLVAGRKLTSWPTLQDDYRNAGARWVDEEVVVDRNFVSSRKPDDIPAFNREMLRVFADSRRAQAA